MQPIRRVHGVSGVQIGASLPERTTMTTWKSAVAIEPAKGQSNAHTPR
jgi:hypothetical protein